MPNYTIEEWIEDYQYAAKLGQILGTDPDALSENLLKYFGLRYPDGAELRCHLVMQAARFVEAHIDELSVGHAGVSVEAGLVFGVPLHRALHEYFTGLADMNRMPSVQEILEIAKRHGA